MKSIRKVVPALALLAIVAVVAVLRFRPAPVEPQAGPTGVAAPAVATAPIPAVANGPATAPTAVPRAGTSSGPGLDGFRRWAAEYARAGAAERDALAVEGRRLVAERRRAMQELIRRDPKAAIDQALPYDLREALPADIAGLIEHPVRARGDLSVMALVGEVSGPAASYERVASVGSRHYQAFVYGSRVDQITTSNDHLLGVAVDDALNGGVIALREESFEMVSKAEADRILAEKSPLARFVATHRQSDDGPATPADEAVMVTGDGPAVFCCAVHAGQWSSTNSVDALGGTIPSTGRSAVVPPTHAQGDKRFLVVRLRFANQASDFEPISDSDLASTLQRSRDTFARWSYGKLQSEFVYTPVFTAPRTEDEYAAMSSPESVMTQDLLAIAAAYQESGAFPYVSTNFNFRCMVFVSDKVGTRYCGLAQVGGADSWMRCAWSISVFAHEWGHNFVLKHANQWEATTLDPIGPGVVREYGGRYSTMHAWFRTDNPISPAFNTGERWQMGWLAAGDVLQATTNGVYRIHSADTTNLVSGRAYGLRFPKDHRIYAMEYRPDFRADGVREFHTDNGLVVMWTSARSQFTAGTSLGTMVLDMHPRTFGDGEAGTVDSPLLVGRTFTDAEAGLSVTPLRVGGSGPERYIEVDVRVGRETSNSPPVALVKAASPTVALNTPLDLSVDAADPDGDVLSVSWDFGDRTYSADDATTQRHQWTVAGDYVVEARVSDRRGGVAVSRTVVKVGTPSTFSLSGRVATAAGRPVAGVLVSDAARRLATTDPEGRWVLTGVPAGANQLAFNVPGFTVVPGFANPIAVAGPMQGLDAVATSARAVGLLYERWNGIAGIGVSNLVASPRYAGPADESYILFQSSEPQANVGDNHGVRLGGWLHPDQTGPHTLLVASDDASQVWLSTDESFANLALVAEATRVSGYQAWNRYASQRSAPIQLVAGRRYAFRALLKEGLGNDYISVGLDLPDSTTERPVSIGRFEPLPVVTFPTPETEVSVAAAVPDATEGGAAGTFRLSRSGATTSPLTVYYTFSGDASPGLDYTVPAFSAVIPAGSAFVDVPLNALSDVPRESVESVTLLLSPTAGYRVGTALSATIRVLDDSPAEVSISTVDGVASETGANTARFRVTRFGRSSGDLVVNYTVSGTATSGVDFRALSGSVVIPAGGSSADILLEPLSDELVEDVETVVLTLASGSYTLISPTTANASIDLDVSPGRGILREWFSGIPNGLNVADLTTSPGFPDSPTGREIVTTAFESLVNRAERFGERWRAVYTAGGAGEHRFNIYADDAAELWFSEDPSGAGARVIASVRNATQRRSWTGRAGQESAGIRLAAGQKVYLEVRWVEATGGDSMGVGVRHPNGLLERPIPGHRLDPFTPNRTPLPSPWVAQAVGPVPAGRAGFGLEPIVVPPVNRFRFDGVAGSRIESGSALRDEFGGGDAVVRGPGARFAADGSGVSLPGGDIAFSPYIDLPNGIVSGSSSGSRRTAVSLEAWVTFRGAGETPPMLFFSGTDMVGEVAGSIPAETPYAGLGLFPAFFEPQQDFQVLTRFDADRIEDPPFGGAASPLPRDRPVHVVLSYDATSRLWTYYRDGLPLASITDPLGPGEIRDVNNWLGRGYFDFFPALDGVFHEFRVYDYALSPSQVRGNTVAGPDAVGIPNPSPITLFGSGTLSTNVEDSFHFEAQPVEGGVDLRVRLASFVTTNVTGTAGLMLRDDAGAGSPHAFLGASPDGGLRFLSRTDAGSAASIVSVSGVPLPVWLRLERSGGSVVASHSADGTNWTRVAAVQGLLVGDSSGGPDSLLAGLAAASPEPNSSAYAVFENLTIGRNATVATLAATSVGTRSATLRASVNPNGAPTTLSFDYGATSLYGRSSQTNQAGAGLAAAVVEIPVSGLLPHTTYQYQAVARSASGPFSGGNLEFTTLNTVPVAVDDAPAPLTASSAVTLAVLANDSDADGDRLTIQSVTQGARGSVAIAAGATRLIYDPSDAYAGPDSFTYTVSDGFGGTATATVRVVVPDTAAPSIAGTFSPLALATGPAGTALLPDFLAQASIADNVGVASASQTPPAGTPVPVGSVEVRLASADAAGNTSQRALSVAVADGTAPVLTSVPGPMDLAPGVTTLPDLAGGVVATDNVGVTARTQSPAAGTTLAVGVHTVTLTARDAAGNTATADVRVTVNPATPPTVAFARSPRNVDADAACAAVAPDLTTLADLVVTGGSGPYTFSQSLVVGTSLSLGSRYTNVTTVTGSDGAAAFATNVVVVRDVLAPVFTRIPADVSTNVAPGVLGIVPDLAALATATDCNGPVVYSQSVAAGALQLPGARAILVHAVDASGNTNSVSVTFTVHEVLPPVAEIALVGNGLVIADGDAEPDSGDHTDFGTTGTGAAPVVRTFTVRNTGNAPLAVGSIGVAGAHADEFTVAGPTLPATVPAGTNVDFTVSFAPGAGGLRIATVTVGSDDPDSPAYDFAVQGVGLEAASVTTLAATDAVGASARLHARIRARNATTAVTFQYGTNTSYGTEVPAVPATVSGDDETPVEAVLAGLVPGLEYHFRAVAVNTNGTAFGADLVFATATSAPNVAPVVAVASSVVSLPEGTTAQVSGTVSDADGDAFVLAASIGAVAAGTEAGTWTWSGPAVDGSQVTITATDSHGAAGLAAFTLSVTNVPPLLASSGDVSVGEGSTAVRTGTWSDPGGDIVTLSASTGSVLKEDAGTWSWSLATTDGPEQGANVTITATDADGGVRTTTFLLTVTNVVPAVTSAGAVTVGEGRVASNSGTWFDPGADTVSLTVSAGTVVRDASGSWTWAFTPADGPEATQTVTVTATDSDGAVGTSAFELTVTNLPPTVAAAGPVTVGEGLTATNTGTWGDPGADSVTLSASAGTVVRNANGTWSWSLATADGPEDGRTVTITATDSDGATATAAFDLVVENRPPVLANAGNRSVSAGATATNTGTWSDPGTDSVVLTASVGTVTRNDDGTWSWSFDTTGALSQQVVVTGTDADGLASTTAFNLSVDASTGATFVWNAAANGANWSTPSSWTVTAGSDDDGIPDSNDAVVFNATRSTSSTVGASFAVKSVEVAAGYGGAIALGANTLSVSAGFSVVPTGAFNPGNGTVRFVGSQDVSIPSVLVNVAVDGGAAVALKSDLTLWGNGTLSGNGRILNGGGRLLLGRGDQVGYVVNFTGTVDDLVLVPGFNADIALGTNLVVNGSLTVAEMRTLNGPGVLRVHGRATSTDTSWFNATSVQLVGTDDQPLNGNGIFNSLVVAKPSGDVVLTNDMTLAYGTLSGRGRIRNDGGRLILGKGDQNGYVVNFNGAVDDLVLVPGFNADIALNTNLVVNGSLLVGEIRTLLGPGVLHVNGRATSTDTSWGSTTSIRLVGTNDQLLNGNGMFNHLVVAKPGGDVVLTNDMTLAYGTLSGTGRIRNGGGRLVLGKGDQNGYVANFTGTVDDLVLVPGFNADIALNTNLVVNGSLLVGEIRTLLGPGVLHVNGRATSTDTSWGATTSIRLVGANDQLLNGNGMFNRLVVAKPGGDVVLTNDMTLAYGALSGTGRFRNDGGRLVLGKGDQNGYVANFTGTVDDLVLVPGFNADIALSTNLVVNGSLLVGEIRTLLGPGALLVNGRATSTDTSWGATTSIRLVGTNDQLLNGNGMFNHLVVAKPGGDVVLTNDMTLAYGALSGTGRIRNNGGRLVFGKGDQNGYVANFTGTVDDLVLVPGFNADIALSTNLVVNGSLTVAEMRTLNGPGVLRVHGAASSFDASWFNATSVQLVGTNDQPLNGTGIFNSLLVAKPSGDVVLTNDMTLAYGTLSGRGRIRNDGGRLILGKGDQNGFVVNFNGAVDDLVLVPGFNADIALNTNLVVNGSLLVGEIRTLLGPGVLHVNGRATSTDTSWGSTTSIRLVGTNDQLLNGNGMFNHLVVAKPGGDVVLTNDMTLAYGTLSGTGRIRNSGGRLVLGKGDQQGYVANFTGTVDDLVLVPGFNADIALGTNLVVSGSLTVAEMRTLNGPGVLRVHGRATSTDTSWFNATSLQLVGSGDQLLNGNGIFNSLVVAKPGGDVVLTNDMTLAYGTLSGTGRIRNNGGRLVLGKGDQNGYVVNFTGTVDDVVFVPGFNADIALNTNLVVKGSLTVAEMRTLNGPGVLKVHGAASSFDASWFNATSVQLVGSNDQALNGTGMFNTLVVAKTGGDVVLTNDMTLAYGTLSGTGRIRNNGGRLVLGRGDQNSYAVNFAGTVDDVTLVPGFNADIQLLQNLTVNGSLNVTEIRTLVGPGALRVNGTASSFDASWFANTTVQLVGTNHQVLNGTGMFNNLVVAKTGGDVLLTNDMTLAYGTLAGTGRIRNGGGRLLLGRNDQNGYTVNFAGTVDDLVLLPGFNADINLSQNLTVPGTLSVAVIRSLNGPGLLRVEGDVTSNDNDVFGNGFVSLVGTADQRLLGTGRLGNLDISKPAGNVLMSTFNRSFGQVTVSAGTWDVLGNTVSAGSGFLVKGGVVTGVGTLVGVVTGQNHGVLAPGSATVGVLNTGSLVLNGETVFRARVNGTSGPGVDHDQLNVAGSVSLGNARLELSGSAAAPSDATQVVLVNNDSTDAVSGTFADLPQNAVVNLNGTAYRISYSGGTGNDVTLSAVGATTGTLVASLDAGTLTVTDSDSTGRPNRLGVVVSGTDLVVSDAAERFTDSVPSGATRSAGDRTLTIPLSAVTDRLVLNLAGGNDILTVDFSGGAFPFAVEFAGGAGTLDQLDLAGGSFGRMDLAYTNATSGRLSLDPAGADPARDLSYAGVEHLILARSGAEDVALRLPPVANNAVLEDEGGVGNRVSRLRSSNGTLTQVEFSSPTNALTVLRGSEADTLVVNDLPDLKSGLVAGSPSSPLAAVTVAGSLSPAADRSIELFSNGTLNLSTANSDLATLGVGSIRLVSARDVVFAAGAAVSTVDGPVLVEANLQSPPTAAGFVGIAVNGASVQSLGAGPVTLRGAPGSVGTNPAISVAAASTVSSVSGRLEIVADSLALAGGSVSSVTGTVAVRPNSAGVAVTLGAADAAGVLGLTDTELDLLSGSRLELGSTNSGTLTVSAAVTRPSTTSLTLRGSAVNWTSAGSVDTSLGALSLDARGGAVTWSQPGAAVNAGSLQLSAGDLFRPALTSPTAVRTLNVVGEVRLGDAVLDLDNGGFAPVVGTSFLVVANDGMEPVVGTFRDLPEGSVVAVGGGLFTVTYVGGTGNDVVLGSVAPRPEIAIATQAGAELVDGQATPIDFGLTSVGTPVVRSFVLRNRGSSTLTVSGASAPAGFQLAFIPSSVPAGGSTVFQVRMAAAAAGAFSGRVVVNSDDADEAAFDFPVVGVANTRPTQTVDLASVVVGEGSTAVNAGAFGDLDGDAVTLTASVGTLTRGGVAGTVDESTGPAWRTPSVAKAQDADGDNVYGTDGYALWGVNGVETVSNPAYATIRRNPALAFYGGFSPVPYVDIDDAANPAGPRRRTGVVYNQPGGTNVTVFATVTFSQAANVRLGILVDNADFSAISPTTLRVRRTSGAAYDTGHTQAGTPSSRNRSADYYFFDLAAEAGDVFEISGANDPGFGSNGIGGLFLDTRSGSLAASAGTWTWSLGTTDGPSETVVTLTADDGVNAPLVRTFNLVVTNIPPAANLSSSRSGSGLHAADVTLTLGGVSDPSGADTDAGFRHSFDFDNDGTWEVGDGTHAGGASSASATVPPQFLAPAGLRTFKARVTDKDGGSADRTVTVDVVAPPIVSTEPARSPSTNAATLFARVDAQSQPTVLLFEYGTAPDLAGAAVSSPVDAGSAIGARELSLTVPGLRPHTAYHFRAVATNADGVVRGAIRGFETLNTAPVAVADAYDLASAGPSTLTVLANDTDGDGDAIAVEVVSQSANAAVSVAPGGTGIVYDPADGFVGTDLLTYTVVDGFGGRATADVTVRVSDSQPPVFTVCAPSVTLDADASARAVVPDFLASSTVVDNVSVTVRTQSPAAGTGVGLGTNTVTLTARDAAGNEAVCVASLVVRDVTAPTLAATGSEPVVQQWIRRFAGPGQSSESPRQVALDADRNVYVLGDATASGNQDLLLLKYAFDGTLLWSRSYNGPGNGADEAAGIVVSSRGGVFVTGTFRNAARRQDVVVQRIDPATGDLLWQTFLDGADGLDDRAAGVAADAAGNVFVTASTTATATGVDLLVAKLDALEGAPLWRRTFDRGGTEAAAKVVVDAAGNPTVVGQGGSSNPDILTVQFSGVDGSVRWSDLYDSSAQDDRGVSIAVGSAGDLLVTGGSTPASGRFDMLTIRYRAADGARLWTSRHNGPGNQADLPYAVAVGAGGEAYVGGYATGIDRETAATTLALSRDNGTAAWTNRFQGTPSGQNLVSALEVDFDGGVLAFGAGNVGTNLRSMDFVTRKIDRATGTNLWVHSVPGAEGNEVLPRAMAVDGRGSVVLAGLIYEPGRGADVFVWKLGQAAAGPALPSTVDADADCGAVVPDLLSRLTASDAGGTVSLVQSPAAGTRVGAGQWRVVVTATDPSGNATRQTNVFSVVDRVAPVFASGVADVVVCSTNGAGAVAAFTLPTATDSCSVPVVTSDRLSGSVFPVGTTVVTVTAEDASGNRATTTFRVRVNRPPVAAPYSLNVVNNTNVTLAVSRLLGTVNDPDGDAVVVTSVATRSLAGGTMAYNGTNIVYTPPAGFVGGDSFTVNLSDGGCAEVVDTVAVNVTAPQGDLAGATFYVRGARFEVARYKRYITREVWQSLDNGVTWRHLGTIGATGSRTFVIYYTTPAAGHYRFL